MTLFLREFENVSQERWSKHLLGIKALVKGADGLIKYWICCLSDCILRLFVQGIPCSAEERCSDYCQHRPHSSRF